MTICMLRITSGLIKLRGIEFCPTMIFSSHHSLEDILHQDNRIYLVFEYMLMDLKKYIDTYRGQIDPMLVKVRTKHR